MPLFEVAILEQQTKKDAEEGGKLEKLVFGPKAIVARDKQSAGIVAILDATKEITVNREHRMVILVRPFV